MLFLSEAISISGLQAPFCFFTVIIIICVGHASFGLGAPENIGIGKQKRQHIEHADTR